MLGSIASVRCKPVRVEPVLDRQSRGQQADGTKLNWIPPSREFTQLRMAPGSEWWDLPHEPFNRVLGPGTGVCELRKRPQWRPCSKTGT